jgi:hypothetical protein
MTVPSFFNKVQKERWEEQSENRQFSLSSLASLPFFISLFTFIGFFEAGSCYVAQAGLNIQSGMPHYVQLVSITSKFSFATLLIQQAYGMQATLWLEPGRTARSPFILLTLMIFLKLT